MDLALHELTAELVDRRGDTSKPFGLYLVAGDDPAAELGRAVEREVFLEYFGNSRELLSAEYTPYDAASLFMVAVDHQRLVPAGLMRLIWPSPAGLKSLHDIERVWGERVDDLVARSGLTLDYDRVWDMATLAVTSEYRGAATQGLISAACLQATVPVAVACDVDVYVSCVDVVALRLIQQMCSRPASYFKGVEPLRYLDSPASVPVYFDVPDYRTRLRADPDAYATWVEGAGIHDAVGIPDWHEAADLRARATAQALAT